MSESKGQTVHFGATMGGAGKSLFALHLDALSHTFVIAPTGSGMSFNPVATIGNPSDTDTCLTTLQTGADITSRK